MNTEFIPIESDKYPGFYHIPGFPTILVSKDSTVIDSKTGMIRHVPRCPKENESDLRYLTIRLRSNNLITIKSIHHLVALAFYGEAPRDIKNPMVVHLDGNKWNNHVTNLKWTNKPNAIDKSYRSGSRTDNQHVIGKNLLTGEIKEWYSFGDCARYFGVKSSSPFIWVRMPNKVFQGVWIFKIKEDKTPWPDIKWYPGYQNLDEKRRPIIGVNYQKGICVFGDSIKEVSQIAQVNKSTLTVGLKRKSLVSINGWIFKDRDGLPLPESDIVINKPKVKRKLQAYHLYQNICYFTDTVAEMSRIAGIDRYVLKDKLKQTGYCQVGDWYFRYPESSRSFPNSVL